MNNIPEVGDPYCWEPSSFSDFSENASATLRATTRVSGRIVYVNREHGWFRAEAECNGTLIRECFPIA